jgi:hypothetical protein
LCHNHNRQTSCQPFLPYDRKLADFIADADRRGGAVYYACATFRDEKKRTQQNALTTNDLWADIDLKRSDGTVVYESKLAIIKHVLEFCQWAKIPPPTFVDTGNGFHIHWTLRIGLAPKEWLTLSSGLRGAFRAFGLKVDPARTCDIASILRPPGTHNRKGGGELLVKCGPLVGPYDIEAFKPLLEYTTQTNASAKKGTLGSTETNLVTLPKYEPADAAKIARNCAQVAAFFIARGNQSEPVWHANVGVMAYCRDGFRLAHTVSAGDNRYTEKDTQDRLDRVRSVLTGATTCARFHDVNPEPCEACPFWQKIKSPISLGWTQKPAPQENSSDDEARDDDEPTQRDKLISVGLEGELWHDKDGYAFATVKVDGHLENFSIKSSSYRRWLTRTYGDKNIRKVGGKLCPSAPSAQAVNEALNTLDAVATRGQERQAAIRVAGHNGSIYLDLGQPEWSAVEISSAGRRIVDAPPVRFIRPKGLRPLPTPVRGGNISELRKFLNVGTDGDFAMGDTSLRLR